MSDENTISFASPGIRKCPFQAYDRLRNEAPVYRDPLTGVYVLTRYADIREALLNVEQLSNRSGVITTRQSANADKIRRMFEEKGWVQLDMLGTDDPPSHKMYRALVDKAFSAVRVDKLEGHIDRLVNELIDGFIDDGEVEFVSRFSAQLSTLVMADQLGISRADFGRFKRWTDVTVELMSPAVSPERELEATPEIIALQNYFAHAIEKARSAPADDLVSKLVHTVVDGRSLTVQEMVIIMQMLLVAGSETTASALSHGVRLMAENPEVASKMRQDPAAIMDFMDEALRLMSPVQALFRKAKTDLEIAGVKIPKGAVVQVQYGAANRDPEMFPNPERFDIGRSNANKHLAFGAGIHYCVGHQLSRKELLVTFRNVLRRMKNLRPARGADSVIMADSYTTFGLAELHLAFDKA